VTILFVSIRLNFSNI